MEGSLSHLYREKKQPTTKDETRVTLHIKEYPSNAVSPVPGGFLGSGGLIPRNEPRYETSVLTLKSSTGLRVTTARHEGHEY
jgi:hypothetical protein